jgi:hypothetical protein
VADQDSSADLGMAVELCEHYIYVRAAMQGVKEGDLASSCSSGWQSIPCWTFRIRREERTQAQGTGQPYVEAGNAWKYVNIKTDCAREVRVLEHIRLEGVC